MKKTLKLASLTFLMFGCAVASEFRPPMSADRGSQRLDMKAKRSGDSAWELDMYSTAYNRNATKTFTKHGTKTAPLTTLMFGKAEFKVADALPQNLTKDYSEEFNTNLNATTLYPRVSYNETGINLGGKLGYRVYGGKGMLGLKVNVPLKTVRMERDNTAETAEQGGGQSNYVYGATAANVTIPVDIGAAAAAGLGEVKLYTAPINTVGADLYKISAVRNLPFAFNGGIAPFIHHTGGGNQVAIGGQAFAADPATVPTAGNAALGIPERADIPFVFFSHSDPKTVPNILARAIKLPGQLRGSNHHAVAAQSNAAVLSHGVVLPAQAAVGGAAEYNASVLQGGVIQAGGARITDVADISISGAPGGRDSTAITHVNGNAIAVPGVNPQPFARILTLDPAALPANFAADTLYALPNAVTAAQYRDLEALFEKNKDTLWMMTVSQPDGNTRVNAGQNDALKGLITRYGSESAEQWLWRNGYAFATNQRTGLGDITVTPCYDHMFSRSWHGGVYLHLLIPTGGSRKTGDNPYKARLGNDNHVELGGGANVAWQAMDWMNLRLDAMAAYALPAKERVSAPFKGATVKNVGPAIDVDVDYTRLKASLDTTMVHPSASSLATTIGYDFEYKTKDNVSLKNKKHTFKTLADDANSWFGGFWDNGAGAFRAKEVDLDSAVQAKDTERISHNLRVESSWHATQHLSLFWGGSTPLFGQNVAKMNTIYGGMNVKF